jgi:3-oxoacyl-[acyl-carrier-protein] synthase II
LEMKKSVVIGYDAISPLGIDLDTSGAGPGRGKRHRPADPLSAADGFPVRIAGQAPDIDHLPYPFLKPPEQARWPSPVFKYALLSVARALEKSGIADHAGSPPGGHDLQLGGGRAGCRARPTASCGPRHRLPLPANPNSCINMVGGKISMLTGATGPIPATITACATGLTSMIVGAMLLAQDRADVVICGAVDFALVEPIVAGFYTMNGAYNPKGRENEPRHEPAGPFPSTGAVSSFPKGPGRSSSPPGNSPRPRPGPHHCTGRLEHDLRCPSFCHALHGHHPPLHDREP